MERGRAEVKQSVEQVAEAGESLERIATVVAEITNVNAQVALAAKSQSQTSEDIDRNITKISGVAMQTARDASDLINHSKEMQEMTLTLQSLAGQFKV
jgi:methyl-accepting chemotaxis protein